MSDYFIQKKSGDEINEKKLSGNIPAFGYFLIVSNSANEILYYLGDEKYDNFLLTKNDEIFLRKKNEIVDSANINEILKDGAGEIFKKMDSGNFEIADKSTLTNSKNENGPTYLSGAIDENVKNLILTKAGNPYIINNGFFVQEGKTLNIGPGVVIWPKNSPIFIGLIVSGTIKINGTVEEPVKFTSLKKNPMPGDYNQALLIQGSGANSVLENVVFEYGDMMMVDLFKILAMVKIFNVDVKISNAVFRKSRDKALELVNSNSQLENVLFEDNEGIGLFIENSQPELKNCEFKNNKIDIINNSVTVSDNL